MMCFSCRVTSDAKVVFFTGSGKKEVERRHYFIDLSIDEGDTP